MSDLIAVSDGEVVVAVFVASKSFFDASRYGGKAVGVGGLDIDLLDLGGTGGFIKRVDIHNEGIVVVEIIEVDGFVDFVEDADDHEFFAHDFDSLADGTINGVKEGEGKSVAKDDRLLLIGFVEEGAVADGEGFDLGEVEIGAEDGDGV